MRRKIQAGDKVSFTGIKAVAKDVFMNGTIRFERNGHSFWLSRHILAAADYEIVEPPLHVGKAKFRQTGTIGRIVAIENDRAWFQSEDGAYYTIATSSLVNIPED